MVANIFFFLFFEHISETMALNFNVFQTKDNIRWVENLRNNLQSWAFTKNRLQQSLH